MESPTIKQLSTYDDDRGWVSEIYSGHLGDELGNIHLGTMTVGTVRGNHYHEYTRECITFMSGSVEVRWKENGTLGQDTITEPTTIELPPGVPHGFKNVGNEVVYFTAYTDTRYDEENPDVTESRLY